MVRVSLFVALAAMAAGPAYAQSTAQTGPTLSPGHALRIAPDGATSTVAMSTDQKMQNTMKNRAKKVSKGLVVWMDEKNQVFYITDPVDTSWINGQPMKGMGAK